MPKANRKCLHCGTPYYACSACIDIRSWKNICCSVECYRAFMGKSWNGYIEDVFAEPIEQDMGEITDMYIVLNNQEKLEVVGYDIPLGRIDAIDGKTYTKNDIDHLQISLEELQEVAKYHGKW